MESMNNDNLEHKVHVPSSAVPCSPQGTISNDDGEWPTPIVAVKASRSEQKLSPGTSGSEVRGDTPTAAVDQTVVNGCPSSEPAAPAVFSKISPIVRRKMISSLILVQVVTVNSLCLGVATFVRNL
jgi:hypothetical protein